MSVCVWLHADCNTFGASRETLPQRLQTVLLLAWYLGRLPCLGIVRAVTQRSQVAYGTGSVEHLRGSLPPSLSNTVVTQDDAVELDADWAPESCMTIKMHLLK